MALSYSEQIQIADRYAQAGYALAANQKHDAATASALNNIKEVLAASADLQRTVRNPVLPEDAIAASFDAIMVRMGAPDIAKQIVMAAIANSRGALLPMIADAFQQKCDHANGVKRGEVLSATPLDATMLKQISDALSSEGEEIALTSRVDESLIGGIRVKFGSHMIDASIAGTLSRMRAQLKQPVMAETAA